MKPRNDLARGDGGAVRENGMHAVERANAQQRAASDPDCNVFVAASAGSGKTKLLTDRLLRLMLRGADPGRILCLTFTKAAAAEMALRLQKVLGTWVSLSDAALDAKLAALNITADQTVREAARALFGRVLDLPGGMRIETIHAFCQSLLRRFPLEAQLSPHFQVVETADDRAALQAARETHLATLDDDDRTALGALAGLVNIQGFSQLVETLMAERDRLQPLLGLSRDRRRSVIAQAADLRHADEAAMIAGAVVMEQEIELVEALRLAAEQGSPGVRTKAAGMLDWLGLSPALRAERWSVWLGELLTSSGEPRAASRFCNEKLATKHPNISQICVAEAARVAAVEQARSAHRMVDATCALLDLAAPVLRAYETRKDRAAQLDYNDLVRRTILLLRDPGTAWVLYKLDGGIDHVLLDEVQDTAPAQWAVARAITDEFFAGLGARDVPRSFFAVGDRKQSIYSFQGADVAEFEHQRGAFRTLVEGAGLRWLDGTLDVSFRSAAPVLRLVDTVFSDPIAAEGVTLGETLAHVPAREGAAGRVELWPLPPLPEAEAAEDIPDANRGQASPERVLAEALAGWIAAQTNGTVDLSSRGRKLGPGDVLVLVRRRNRFATALVGALKARGVPVAGMDRLVLTEQPAVQDLLALCDALLLPQDDLAVGCVLTSPLGGLDDDDLIALAAERPPGSTLWETLRRRAGKRAHWQTAWDFLAALFARVDYAAPHALLTEALGRLHGRARLFARLGPEAGEPVDELLNAALTYEAANPPSLQGFVHWLRHAAATVKREAGGAAGVVRVMTVHGAKGLQAPLVVLPDTVALPKRETGGLAWVRGPEDVAVPFWTPRTELCGPAATAAREAKRQRDMAEYNRLLYVALTRAEDRLLVCGWQGQTAADPASWYAVVERAMRTLGADASDFAPWLGEALCLETAQTAPPQDEKPAEQQDTTPLPAWAGTVPDWQPAALPAEPALPRPLAPSRPEGVEHGAVPPALSPLAASNGRAAGLRRGTLVHALLQHLPALPPARRAEAALAYARRVAPDSAEEAAREVLAVLAHPELAALFGAGGRAEVPITGVIGAHVVGGLIDRLAVLPEAVLVADFKTDRAAPSRPEGVPVRYLRQLAAYRAVLRGIHPDREVRCLLVYTRGPTVLALPDTLLDCHAPGTSLPQSA